MGQKTDSETESTESWEVKRYQESGRPDRVAVSFGVTVCKNYNSVRLDLRDESDVRPGETISDARNRVANSVVAQMNEEVPKIHSWFKTALGA